MFILNVLSWSFVSSYETLHTDFSLVRRYTFWKWGEMCQPVSQLSRSIVCASMWWLIVNSKSKEKNERNMKSTDQKCNNFYLSMIITGNSIPFILIHSTLALSYFEPAIQMRFEKEAWGKQFSLAALPSRWPAQFASDLFAFLFSLPRGQFGHSVHNNLLLVYFFLQCWHRRVHAKWV